MDETGGLVGFTNQRQLKGIEGSDAVCIAQSHVEMMFVPCEQLPVHPVQANALWVHGGVRAPLNTDGGQIVRFTERPTAFQRIARQIFTHQHHADFAGGLAVGHNAEGREQRKIDFHLSDTSIEADGLFSVFLLFHHAVSVGVVDAFKPRPHLQLAGKTLRVTQA